METKYPNKRFPIFPRFKLIDVILILFCFGLIESREFLLKYVSELTLVMVFVSMAWFNIGYYLYRCFQTWMEDDE